MCPPHPLETAEGAALDRVKTSLFIFVAQELRSEKISQTVRRHLQSGGSRLSGSYVVVSSIQGTNVCRQIFNQYMFEKCPSVFLLLISYLRKLSIERKVLK